MKKLSQNSLRQLIKEEVSKYIVECGCQAKNYDVPEFPYYDDEEVMSSPVAREHIKTRMMQASGAKCPGSYLKVSDEMAAQPERLMMVLEPVMQELGAECPESTAQAIYDIISMMQGY
jgi:hypothetical protein